MGKIDLTINKTGLQHNIEKAKENNVIIPTIAQMQHPETIPEKIQKKLKTVGLWDVNPLNLFRITWKNEAKESGGLYQAVPNYVEIPSELSGVPCRILDHQERGNVVIDAKDCNHLAVPAADIHGRGLEDLPVRRFGEVAQVVARLRVGLTHLL